MTSLTVRSVFRYILILAQIMILDMLVRRKDHACALVKIDEETGLLVSGGVDGEDNLLDSVEFYNLETQEWEELSPLKKARTEHGKYNYLFFDKFLAQLHAHAVFH